MAFDICIRGAGVVGKTLALLLARQHVRVGLVAGASTGAGAGDIRAFALNAASKALLESLGVWPDAACAVHHIQVQGDDGGHVRFDAQPTQPLAWIVDAAAVQDKLSAALRFATEVQIVAQPHEPWVIAQGELAATQAQPSQAWPASALTVICEGKASATRTLLDIEFEQYAYDQCAIAATIHTELPHQNTARQWMQGGEVCALLPRGASAPGNSMALVWSVLHDHAAKLQPLDDPAFAAALQTACGNALGDVSMSSPRAQWPLQLALARRWVGWHAGLGAWALAGDAAHTVHPLAGQGLNLGLADAAQLAKTLDAKEYFRGFGDRRLLRRYERARAIDAKALRLATDGLQRLFAHEDTRVRALRNWGMQGFEQITPLKTAIMRRAMGVG